MKEQYKRASGQLAKKQKFMGNRCNMAHSDSNEIHFSVSTTESASKRKLKSYCLEDVDVKKEFLGYRMIDITVLFSEVFVLQKFW